MSIKRVTASNLDKLIGEIDDEMAKALWDVYRPPFLHPDSVNAISEIKKPFLAWLISRNIDPLEAGIAALSAFETPATPMLPISGRGRVKQRRRARLDDVSLETNANSFLSKVQLSMHKQQVQASESVHASEAGLAVTARATIEAVRRLVPLVNLDLRAAYTVASRDQGANRVAIVILGEDASSKGPEYAGASSVSSLESEAVARATLAALNRRVDWEQSMLIPAARVFPSSARRELHEKRLRRPQTDR